MLIKKLADYCDYNFQNCEDCDENCNHPAGKCSGSCADCLREIQFRHTNGRFKYDCSNMLRYYTCHTVWKRCSEILYALEKVDLSKYSEFNILSIGCGAAPDFMAFEQISNGKKLNYHGVDIAKEWKEIHDYISWETSDDNIEVDFERRRDIYEVLSKLNATSNSYNAIVLQYMIAGHIHSDIAGEINLLFEEIIDKLIVKSSCKSPLLLIINDIDHKAWICDYFNLLISKLRKYGLSFEAKKRHFGPREENAGSTQYKSRSNQFLSLISPEHRDKYNSHAPCSAAQLIIEVT